MIRFFNPSNLLIEPSAKRIKDSDKILSEMEGNENQYLKEMMSVFETINGDVAKMNVFNSLSKVHELKASTRELDEFRYRVDARDTKEYVGEKRYLESSLTALRKSRPPSYSSLF